ncbi:MAG: DUF4381 domain-containing protein [Actinomycetota bacterium]|nr:DUF4381 domain-containing protein [Actinomycetota bacterium]
MPVWGWILVALAVIAAVLVVWWFARRRRTKGLRSTFGPEYDRTVEESDSRRRAESELTERRNRRAQLDIQPLTPAAQARYQGSWRGIQLLFVDEPAGALSDADRVVTQVMSERGYPMDDFDQRFADLSVDHPGVVHNYRAAHAISMANDQGAASTEDLRQAMVHFRALLEELLEPAAPSQVREVR